MLRISTIRRGAATSNMFAPPFSGRWFNPPHQWTFSDCHLPIFFLFASPSMLAVFLYNSAYAPHYSHFQDKNYYYAWPYTKEFIHKYTRLERWRHY